MDLKSMLNDSASRPQPPPRLHTSSSSISEGTIEQRLSYDAHPDRPTPQPASAYASDSRGLPPGSYFPVVSPQQHNSASTPSAGAQSTHSAYAQSPGPGPAQHFTPRRESVTPQNAYTPGHIPPPSPIGAAPSTPGTQYYPGGHPGGHLAYGQPYPPQGAALPRSGGREDYPQPNGRPSQASPYHMSPPPHHLQTPSTPLGPPPANYPRPPHHMQRPPSQGYDHLRRASIGSVGSAHSRDPNMSHISHAEVNRAASVPRTYSGDEERLRQERERSDEGVSPKTIPRPPPQRNSSHGLNAYEQSPAGSVTSHTSHLAPPSAVEQFVNSMTGTPVQQQSVHPLDARTQQMSRPSPGARPAASMTPQSTHSSLPAQASPVSTKPAPKKRSASVISNTAASSMPPVKRIKREEKPIWAQSARKRQLRLDARGPRPRQPRAEVPAQDFKRETTPGQAQKNGTAPPPSGPQEPLARPTAPVVMDESILPEKPRNDLVFTVCEWIWGVVGQRTPPPGSVFEIEGKLGVIKDVDSDKRLYLPVKSEAIFDRAGARDVKTKFDTSVMSEVAHKGLNDFLNHAITWNRQSIANGAPLYPIEYAHPIEWDEYYELTAEGRTAPALQQLTHWLNPNHRVKVRRTFDKKTSEMKAQIIKTRISDLEIYNPNDQFDYRISISLESPWQGPDTHLSPGGEESSDRLKDRLSYKHRDYQIDLTQISHRDTHVTGHHDHEVEIEINNDSFLAALNDARAQVGDRYEKCLTGFVDNIRILAGHASRAITAAAMQPQPLGM